MHKRPLENSLWQWDLQSWYSIQPKVIERSRNDSFVALGEGFPDWSVSEHAQCSLPLVIAQSYHKIVTNLYEIIIRKRKIKWKSRFEKWDIRLKDLSTYLKFVIEKSVKQILWRRVVQKNVWSYEKWIRWEVTQCVLECEMWRMIGVRKDMSVEWWVRMVQVSTLCQSHISYHQHTLCAYHSQTL